MTTVTEAEAEQAALDSLSGLGWAVAHGPDRGPKLPTSIATTGSNAAGLIGGNSNMTLSEPMGRN